MNEIGKSDGITRLVGGGYSTPESVKVIQNVAPDTGHDIRIGKEARLSVAKTPEDDMRETIERQLYDRETATIERVTNTTLPPEVRKAVRDFQFAFIDAAPGLNDNYGFQRLYSGMDERRASLLNIIKSSKAQKALGYDDEPWRRPKIMPKNNRLEIERSLLEQGLKQAQIEATVASLIKEATDRVPEVCSELVRSRDELVRTRRLFYLFWNMKNAASGNEVGEIYKEAKIPMLPRPKDFANVLNEPAYYMTDAEAGSLKGYPTKEQAEADLIESDRSKENEPLGEMVERESRLILLVAMSENPEEVVKWKHKTEQEELFKLYRAAGVNENYLILKEQGIDYIDPAEEAKMLAVRGPMTGVDEQNIKDKWWKDLGYLDEADGISKMGDPEMWVPMKARRGEVPSDISGFLEEGFDSQARLQEINQEMMTLKKLWGNLDPINNLSNVDKEKIQIEINNSTDRLRTLQTVQSKDKEGRPVLVSIFNTTSLERELDIRKGPAELGCVWSSPQTAGDKEKIMETVLGEKVKGDPLAYEKAKAFTEMCGFQAKHGYYAADYDPTRTDIDDGWGTVNVEGWPYTNEMQTILAWPWYQRYKKEAGGPPASRGKYGPLMTDYLTACVTEERSPNRQKLFIIIDDTGAIRKGTAGEGLVLADTQDNLMNVWQKGISLKDEKLWEGIIEDPFRRWLLRGFFAEGKAVLGPSGDPIMDLWKKQDWKLEDLDNYKIWDNYKLARKVTIRPELFEEEVWRDVVRPVKLKYQKRAKEVIEKIRKESDPVVRRQLIRGNKSIYAGWMKNSKDAVYRYSDSVFGAGLLSIKMIGKAQLEHALLGGKTDLVNDPKVILGRILELAKSRGIDLGWVVSDVVSEDKSKQEKLMRLGHAIIKSATGGLIE